MIFWRHVCYEQQPYDRYEVQRNVRTGKYRHRGLGYSGKEPREWYPYATLKCTACNRQAFGRLDHCSDCGAPQVPMEAATWEWLCDRCDHCIDGRQVLIQRDGTMIHSTSHGCGGAVELHWKASKKSGAPDGVVRIIEG